MSDEIIKAISEKADTGRRAFENGIYVGKSLSLGELTQLRADLVAARALLELVTFNAPDKGTGFIGLDAVVADVRAFLAGGAPGAAHCGNPECVGRTVHVPDCKSAPPEPPARVCPHGVRFDIPCGPCIEANTRAPTPPACTCGEEQIPGGVLGYHDPDCPAAPACVHEWVRRRYGRQCYKCKHNDVGVFEGPYAGAPRCTCPGPALLSDPGHDDDCPARKEEP